MLSSELFSMGISWAHFSATFLIAWHRGSSDWEEDPTQNTLPIPWFEWWLALIPIKPQRLMIGSFNSSPAYLISYYHQGGMDFRTTTYDRGPSDLKLGQATSKTCKVSSIWGMASSTTHRSQSSTSMWIIAHTWLIWLICTYKLYS